LLGLHLLVFLLLRGNVFLVHFDEQEELRVEQHVPDNHLLVQADDAEDGINRLASKLDLLAFGPFLDLTLLSEHRIRLDSLVQFSVVLSQEKH